MLIRCCWRMFRYAAAPGSAPMMRERFSPAHYAIAAIIIAAAAMMPSICCRFTLMAADAADIASRLLPYAAVSAATLYGALDVRAARDGYACCCCRCCRLLLLRGCHAPASCRTIITHIRAARYATMPRRVFRYAMPFRLIMSHYALRRRLRGLFLSMTFYATILICHATAPLIDTVIAAILCLRDVTPCRCRYGCCFIFATMLFAVSRAHGRDDAIRWCRYLPPCCRYLRRGFCQLLMP